MNIGIGDLGKVTECPKCHRLGRVALEFSRAKGKRYVYLAVRHFEHGKARRCLLRRLSNTELSLVKKRIFVSEEEITKLRRELDEKLKVIKELEDEVGKLKVENVQLRLKVEKLEKLRQRVKELEKELRAYLVEVEGEEASGGILGGL